MRSAMRRICSDEPCRRRNIQKHMRVVRQHVSPSPRVLPRSIRTHARTHAYHAENATGSPTNAFASACHCGILSPSLFVPDSSLPSLRSARILPAPIRRGAFSSPDHRELVVIPVFRAGCRIFSPTSPLARMTERASGGSEFCDPRFSGPGKNRRPFSSLLHGSCPRRAGEPDLAMTILFARDCSPQ